MIFYNEEQRINFVHIPRTGGRYIAESLIRSGYLEAGNNASLYGGIRVGHLHYELDREYWKPWIWTENSFTVVRDPVDRFISSLGILKQTTNWNSLDHLEDYEHFKELLEQKPFEIAIDNYRMLHYGLINSINNAWRPQSQFISEHTKVWKFEDGLGDNFFDWLKSNVNVNIDRLISAAGQEYTYTKYDYDFHDYTVSDKVKENVAKYYQDDYKLLTR